MFSKSELVVLDPSNSEGMTQQFLLSWDGSQVFVKGEE